jgi:predicted transcriptional regulator
MSPKRSTTFRLTDHARALILRLAEKLGVSQTAVLELAVRKLAKTEGVKAPQRQE